MNHEAHDSAQDILQKPSKNTPNLAVRPGQVSRPQVTGLRTESQCSAQNSRPHCTPPILDLPLAWRKMTKKASNHQPDPHWLYTQDIYIYIYISICCIYIYMIIYIYHHVSPYCE